MGNDYTWMDAVWENIYIIGFIIFSIVAFIKWTRNG